MAKFHTVDMVRAAKLARVSPVICVYANQPELISKVLDMGAEGFSTTNICTRSEFEAAVKAAKFHQGV